MKPAKAVIAPGFILVFPLLLLVALKGCAGHTEVEDARTHEPYCFRGKWKIDAAASADYARRSPRWREEDELYARRVLDMMAERYFILIGPESITLEAGDSRSEIPVTAVEAAGGRHVYRGVFPGMEIDFELILSEGGNLNLRSSLSDDFAYILWERDD